MSKCLHTGLPPSMCAHCTGLRQIEPEPFHGRKRDEVLGQSTGQAGPERMRTLASHEVPNRSCFRNNLNSDWRRQNEVKALADTLKRLNKGISLNVPSFPLTQPIPVVMPKFSEGDPKPKRTRADKVSEPVIRMKLGKRAHAQDAVRSLHQVEND